MQAGVYVQVPFCQTKCTYCNFHTGVFSQDLYAPYVDAVCREIRRISAPAARKWNRGNSRSGCRYRIFRRRNAQPSRSQRPSRASSTRFARRFRLRFRRSDARGRSGNHHAGKGRCVARSPDSTASAWACNRFDDSELRAAGRMHRRADIFNATQILRDAGFRNISFDLIAGLPHQTDRSWEDSVGQLLALRPEHVSIYMMEIDEGSRLGLEVLQRRRRDIPRRRCRRDDAMAGFYERGLRATGRRRLRAL